MKSENLVLLMIAGVIYLLYTQKNKSTNTNTNTTYKHKTKKRVELPALL